MLNKLYHKSILTSIYEHGNHYFYNFVCNKKLVLNDIIREIKNQNEIDIEKSLVYLVRIWNRYSNIYAFKVGYTTDLYKRLGDLDNQYESNCRLIIIACANIENIQIENQIHNELRKKHNNVTLGRNIKSKPRELYETNFEIYNDFIIILENMGLSYFESKNYTYDNKTKIEYIHDKDLISCIDTNDNDDIHLDQKINEDRYWLYKYKQYLKY